jgi:hypothetical protein
VKLGADDNDATALFDTELLRYAGGWTGGFLNYTGVAFDARTARIRRPTARSSSRRRKNPASAEGSQDFKDPRKTPFGPLPHEVGALQGSVPPRQSRCLPFTPSARRMCSTRRRSERAATRAVVRDDQD